MYIDIFILTLGFLFALLGIIGSFLPVLPGPFTSWVGLLILHLTEVIPLNWTFLGITLVIAIIIWIVDYFIPAMGTKKFGGTRSGVIGSTIGLIIGVFVFPPFGIILGPFVGAVVGEMIKKDDFNKALKSGLGSFIGFLLGTGLKLIVSSVMFYYFFKEVFA